MHSTAIAIVSGLCLTGLFYLLMLFILYRGVLSMRPGISIDRPRASVIVAARDEEDHLPGLIDALMRQNYPKHLYELIVVNDRSTDSTGSIIDRYTAKYSNVRQIKINETHPGIAPKKWALTQGITQAKGAIILTTDADCVPGPDWIASMIRYLDPGVALVAGYSPLDYESNRSLLHQFADLEALGLAGVMAGSIGAGYPLTCSGRNLAYRKSVYEEVNGFSKIAHFISGDDDLFLHLLREKTNCQFRFSFDPKSVVRSRPPESYRHLSNQRTRHASKGLHYRPAMVAGLVAVYLLNCLIIASLIFNSTRIIGLCVWGLKMVFEFLLLHRVARVFSKSHVLRLYPIAALIHVPYIVIFGVWGQFGKFTWKGATHLNRMSPRNRSENH